MCFWLALYSQMKMSKYNSWNFLWWRIFCKTEESALCCTKRKMICKSSHILFQTTRNSTENVKRAFLLFKIFFVLSLLRMATFSVKANTNNLNLGVPQTVSRFTNSPSTIFLALWDPNFYEKKCNYDFFQVKLKYFPKINGSPIDFLCFLSGPDLRHDRFFHKVLISWSFCFSSRFFML